MFTQHNRASLSSGVIALAMCSALATAIASPATGFPTGTYAAGGTTTVTFDGDGHVHVRKGNVMEVVGDYTVTGDRIQLTDRSGPWACTGAGEESGSYRWKYENGVLAFSKLSDRCTDRAASLTQYTWKQRK